MSEPTVAQTLTSMADARPEKWVESLMEIVRENRMQIRGISFLMNTVVGNTREAIDAVAVLTGAMDRLREDNVQLRASVSELREKVDAMEKRLNRQGDWITCQSKKGKP